MDRRPASISDSLPDLLVPSFGSCLYAAVYMRPDRHSLASDFIKQLAATQEGVTISHLLAVWHCQLPLEHQPTSDSASFLCSIKSYSFSIFCIRVVVVVRSG